MSIQELLLLSPNDNVFVSKKDLKPGTYNNLHITQKISSGHKIARVKLKKNNPIIKYNHTIGYASKEIDAGELVHTHNVISPESNERLEVGISKIKNKNKNSLKFFDGYSKDSLVGTRNYIGVISSVNCSATVVKAIAEQFKNINKKFKNIDGVVPIIHSSGCAMDEKGIGFELLRRTLSGYINHVNFSAILVVGLGCESNQVDGLIDFANPRKNFPIETLNIQDTSGSSDAVSKGIKIINSFIPKVEKYNREPVSVSNLVVGLQCGGSDGYSGITANPALGKAVDILISSGGSAILSETPEIYGAEDLLLKNVKNSKVAKKLLDLMVWWEAHAKSHGSTLNNNPSPGNIAGGITTIQEKALGAVAKGGSSTLMDVIGYAEKIKSVGLTFMDSPGYDPVSATGQVASGANIICFTTGRGSAYGCMPTPSIKISTNTKLWNSQNQDIDLNSGTIIDSLESVDQVGLRIFEEIIQVASGKKTKSEVSKYGFNEFVPWHLGAMF